ncbi:YheT family hydrolase [Lutibacter sp.]|uniref:YheT family hydrolase n=1 Tax=Lutibacter sp. TaxID=1925666 RepID=UPI0035634737
MPLLKSTYNPSVLYRNSHFNTAYKTLFFTGTINYSRERIKTGDDDFIDLDSSSVGSDTLVLALHGLEGSSKSKYIISALNFLNSQNIDGAALNFRGCSGEDNNKPYSYHSGKTDDVDLSISYLLSKNKYRNIFLLGFSMGGNIALKYMGTSKNMPSEIKGALAISVPCDLKGSATVLESLHNIVYQNMFMKTLREKSLLKFTKFPESNLSKEAIENAKTFKDFDNAVTAPLFGYKNADDYWERNSSKQFISEIYKPTLLINALDDSFLSESCFPFSEAENHQKLYFEAPKYGGHVGFNSTLLGRDLLWSEKRIFEFIKHHIS